MRSASAFALDIRTICHGAARPPIASEIFSMSTVAGFEMSGMLMSIPRVPHGWGAPVHKRELTDYVSYRLLYAFGDCLATSQPGSWVLGRLRRVRQRGRVSPSSGRCLWSSLGSLGASGASFSV